MAQQDRPPRKPKPNKPKPKPDWQPKNLGSNSFMGQDVYTPDQIARAKRLGAMDQGEAASMRQLYKQWNDVVQQKDAELQQFNQEFGPQSYPTYPGTQPQAPGKPGYGPPGPTDQNPPDLWGGSAGPMPAPPGQWFPNMPGSKFPGGSVVPVQGPQGPIGRDGPGGVRDFLPPGVQPPMPPQAPWGQGRTPPAMQGIKPPYFDRGQMGPRRPIGQRPPYGVR